MTRDLNKGVGTSGTDGITYNHLNLPTEVVINDGGSNNGTITYIYDATGVKLQKNVLTNGVTTPTDYAGNFVYENDNLKQFGHAQGYVQANADGNFDYVYSYLDHLGTVRLTYSDFNGNGSIEPATEILQERNTYPFGLEHKGYNGNINGTQSNYQTYLGQEMNNELGLDWLTFRYRNYIPEIGRFFGSDPISEEYFTISPYQFAHNNPVWKVEIEGLEGENTNMVKDVVTHEPIKLRKLPTLSKSTVGGGKLVLNGKGTIVIKRTAKKSVLRRLVSTLAKGAGNTITMLLSTQGLNVNAKDPNPLFKPPSTEIVFTDEQQKTIENLNKRKIDKKLRIKDLRIENVSDTEDEPVRRIFERNPKHGRNKRGRSNAEPTNPQEVLDNSIELPGNTTRRIGVDTVAREFVIFDEHLSNSFHGHVRTWDELNQTMQALLRKEGLVDRKGRIK